MLIAAADDPILAAWASVIHEHRMPANSEVSPYDHLEAFQNIFTYGFISSCEYNDVDEKKEFFSGKIPRSSDVQTVLHNLKLIPEMKENMSTPKTTINAFKNQSAIATVKPNMGLAGRDQRGIGQGRAVPAGIQAFSPNREALPPNKQPRQISAFEGSPVMQSAPRQGLQCASPDPMMSTGLQPKVECCGYQIELTDEGGDMYGDDVLPDDENPFVEFTFHGTCNLCDARYHFAVAKPYPRGSL